MNSFILNRSQGTIDPNVFHYAQTANQTHCLAPAPGIRFNASASDQRNLPVRAHRTGTTVLCIDPYDKRFMLSGAADASIHLWDLETRGPGLEHVHKPVASSTRTTDPTGHTYALTSLSIYPFDETPSTILTTSHDATLKLSSLGPDRITCAYTFKLNTTPYSHSLSAHPSSLLMTAVGTADKVVRILDMRSGLGIHGLPGHSSSVLSVAWAPHREYLLASASTDSRVLVFDVRRGGKHSAIASLDMDDTEGIASASGAENNSRPSYSKNAFAHDGAVTGVRWTDDGRHIVTAGQDSRIRVWDASTGANMLVHFGPRVKNSASSYLAERAPLLVPKDTTTPLQDTLFWANNVEENPRGEILMLGLREGQTIAHLNVPGVPRTKHLSQEQPHSLAASPARINALAWRGNGASGQGVEMFSAHGDGTIRSWVSRDYDEIGEEVEGPAAQQTGDSGEQQKKRKIDALDGVYRGLVGKDIRFT